VGDLPAILRRENTPEPSSGNRPIDVYIRNSHEGELLAINQRQAFNELRRTAGDRGFTYLGRIVTKDMTFDECFEKAPIGEVDTGANFYGLAL